MAWTLCLHISIKVLRAFTFHLGNRETTYLLSIKKSMLREQRGAARSEMARERNDLSCVAVFLCQEHQLRGMLSPEPCYCRLNVRGHCALMCHKQRCTNTRTRVHGFNSAQISVCCFQHKKKKKSVLTCCTSPFFCVCVRACSRSVRAFAVSFVNDGFAKVLRRETLVCYAFDSLLVWEKFA